MNKVFGACIVVAAILLAIMLPLAIVERIPWKDFFGYCAVIAFMESLLFEIYPW